MNATKEMELKQKLVLIVKNYNRCSALHISCIVTRYEKYCHTTILIIA